MENNLLLLRFRFSHGYIAAVYNRSLVLTSGRNSHLGRRGGWTPNRGDVEGVGGPEYGKEDQSFFILSI